MVSEMHWRQLGGLTAQVLVVILGVSLLQAGCGGEAEDDRAAGTAAAQSTATAKPTSTTTGELPEPVVYGPTVLVAGREDCELYPPAVPPTQTVDADGTLHFRGGRFECVVANNDPRIAGIAHYTLDLDRWGTSEEDTAHAMWGTVRIENDGGGWEADYVGVYTAEWGDVFTAVFAGTGGYEGFSYFQWAVETFGSSRPTKGLIFPGDASLTTDPEITIDDVVAASAGDRGSSGAEDLPAPIAYGPTVLVAGREDCLAYPPAIPPAVTTDADGTVHFRDLGFECTVTNNDPRIAGTSHDALNMDRWLVSGQEAAQVMWGTTRIENEDGGWEAEYVGVYTSEWGDVFAVMYTGTGGYEGLSYYQWAVETFGSSWPTKGLIFPGRP